MPGKDGKRELLKRELVARIEADRARLVGETGELQRQAERMRDQVRRTLDVKSRLQTAFRASVRRHPLGWPAGALLAAAVTTRILASRRRNPPREDGDKIASQKRKSILTTLSFALGFAGKTAFRALRPSLERSMREGLETWLDRPPGAGDRRPQPPASTSAFQPPSEYSQE